MTPEGLRTTILQGLDEIQSRPLVWLSLSHDQQRLVKAQRNYWQTVEATELQDLLTLFNKEP